MYPLIMTVSAIATLALGAKELISAMILLGFGLPALAVLLMGAWIDTSAAMYSSSLSLANQLPRTSFHVIVGAIWLVGVALVVAGVETVFIPFLMILGMSLPPLAAILAISRFLPRREGDSLSSIAAAASWISGSLVGFATTNGLFRITGLPAVDSIATSAMALVLLRQLLSRSALPGAKTGVL